LPCRALPCPAPRGPAPLRDTRRERCHGAVARSSPPFDAPGLSARG
jgi:hypothetical protein